MQILITLIPMQLHPSLRSMIFSLSKELLEQNLVITTVIHLIANISGSKYSKTRFAMRLSTLTTDLISCGDSKA